MTFPGALGRPPHRSAARQRTSIHDYPAHKARLFMGETARMFGREVTLHPETLSGAPRCRTRQNNRAGVAEDDGPPRGLPHLSAHDTCSAAYLRIHHASAALSEVNQRAQQRKRCSRSNLRDPAAAQRDGATRPLRTTRGDGHEGDISAAASPAERRPHEGRCTHPTVPPDLRTAPRACVSPAAPRCGTAGAAASGPFDQALRQTRHGHAAGVRG